jgi:SAM-dependent methyltransferase
MIVPENSEAVEAWNTVLFDKFVAFREVLTSGLGHHGTAAMDRHPPARGARVVDLGCGFGDTSAELARRVGTDGKVLGVDAAARFIESARGENTRAPHLTFEVADIEAGVPGGPYDYAFSRFGTMFFASAVAALRNVRKVLVPGGTLCMVVWRKKDANPALAEAELVVRELLGDPPKGDQVTCGPGPFSMASPDLVSDQLLAAGFRDIQFERNDADIMVGKSVARAVDFALKLGPAGEVVRLAGAAAEARRDELEGALGSMIEKYVRADGVWMPSSTWIVVARTPA